MTNKTKPYKGRLNTKIKYPKPRQPSIVTGALDENVKKQYLEECKQYASKVTGEKFLKLLDLLQHYEIDCANSANPFIELALKMAERHVPGFKIQNEIRRKPKTWDPIKLASIYRDVENFSENKPELSKFAICTILHKKDPWNTEKSPKAIYNRYLESEDSALVGVYRKMSQSPYSKDKAKEFFEELIKISKEAQLKKLPR